MKTTIKSFNLLSSKHDKSNAASQCDKTISTSSSKLLIFLKKSDSKISFTLLFKILFIISSFALCVSSTLGHSFLINTISLSISFLAVCLITFKYNLLETIFEDTKQNYLLASLLLTPTTAFAFARNFIVERPEIYMNLVDVEFAKICGRLAMLAVFVFMYAFISRFSEFVLKWLIKLDRVEFFYFIIAGIAMSTLLIVIYSATTVFNRPNYSGGDIYYDVLYTTDSGRITYSNVYQNIPAPENDLRQPLFGVFAMPFGVLAEFITKIFFLEASTYQYIIGVIQIFLLLFSIISVSRMMSLSPISKLLFLCLVSVSFPFIFFSLCAEQYIFALFWLIVLIYVYVNDQQNKDFAFIAACGSLLTSGILFPLISSTRNFKLNIKVWFKTFIAFFAVTALFGRLTIFIDLLSSFSHLLKFTGTVSVSLYEKFLQYLNFVSNVVLFPQSTVITENVFALYRLREVTSLNYLGIVIFILSVVGYLLNRKDKFVKISFFWIVFSFILLFVLGWGTPENGLTLYTLYFSWAFISLVFRFTETIFSKFKKTKIIVYLILIASIFSYNYISFSQLIDFALSYYAVV